VGERKTGGRRAEVAGGRGRADDERRSSVGARSGGRRARAGGALTRGDGERDAGGNQRRRRLYAYALRETEQRRKG